LLRMRVLEGGRTSRAAGEQEGSAQPPGTQGFWVQGNNLSASS
jgi:hypothetical protein